MSGYYLGLDIGGTKCAVILGEAKPEGGVRILERTALLTSSLKKWEDVLKALCVRGGTMLENLEDGRSRLQAVGISCGGPLDSRRGVILSPPNLPGWDQVPAVSFIRERMDRPVFLQNDANACALAEWKYGAGRGCRNMIFLTFGTGLGAGLILNGKLYTGTNDMAGEAGHVRLSPHGPVGYGKEGSFEGFCSGAEVSHGLQRQKYWRGCREGNILRSARIFHRLVRSRQKMWPKRPDEAIRWLLRCLKNRLHIWDMDFRCWSIC